MNNVEKKQKAKDEANQFKNNKPYYLMTLEDNNGELKQIKIYQNSDPFELSYNFCKENNLDFESMKYVKKNIKEIVKKFNEDENYTMIDNKYYEDDNEKKKKKNFNEGKNNKNKKSTNELIYSLVKKNIKLNHSKINRIAPLQKKINEDIQKIYKLKKNELFNSPDFSKQNKKNDIFRNNNYHLLENKIIYRTNKTIGANELKNRRYNFGKKIKKFNNKKNNIFSNKNETCEYGVPELMNNNNINMVKYVANFSKNNELSNRAKEKNDEIKSGNRKFENEDDNEEDESSFKEGKKKEIIDLKAQNNKEREIKFNCIHFNKMINNINNNNYNHNYHINNDNCININNNNIFNNINPLSYNNEYQFNYINSKESMEDVLNFKNLGKRNKISNRTTRGNLNDKFKGIIGFNTKTISGKNSSSNLYSSEYKKIMNVCKRLKKNKRKNIISIDDSKSSESNYSKEIQKTLLNDYKKSVSKSKKIKLINLNKAIKLNNLRGLSSSEEKSMKKIFLNNNSLKKLLFDNNIKTESLKYNSEFFNQEEIAKSFKHLCKNNIYPFINFSKEKKPMLGLTHTSKIIKRKYSKKNLVNNLPKNIKKSNNNLKIKLLNKSNHIKKNKYNSFKNFHLINYPHFKSNFIEFNNLQKNNSNLNYPINSSQVSKYKNSSNFSDRKYINKSFTNNSIIKKDINQQILYNIFSNIFIFLLNENSKLVDTTKSFSKILKIFSPEIKRIYIKMLDYLINCRDGKLYKMINKNTSMNEMINAYNIILTKKEQNILLKRNKNIITNYIQKEAPNNDISFGSENVSPICFKNNLRAISFRKKMSKFVNNTISF